jgi:pyridoxine 5-phosphate synthase
VFHTVVTVCILLFTEKTKMITLSVNIDHIATLRNARGGAYPDPLSGALLAIKAGAAGITAHLREDRRHIRDADVAALKAQLTVPFNLEMAATPEMVAIACHTRPGKCTLVPERRQELTTEGGLDVAHQQAELAPIIQQLREAHIVVSLFVTPNEDQIQASKAVGADMVELHTGPYAEAISAYTIHTELHRLQQASQLAQTLGLRLNAGHGLTVANVGPIARLPYMEELNIGHSIMAQAVMEGLPNAVTAMLAAMHHS